MRRFVFIIFVLLLLFLDWAALHDITAGLEDDYSLEYFMLIISVPIFVGLILIYKRNTPIKGNTNRR